MYSIVIGSVHPSAPKSIACFGGPANLFKEELHLDFDTTVHPCEDGCGALPSCAPLAVPFVPFQQKDPKRYNQVEALSNGTLFPGLNLPFHLKTAPSSLAESAAMELQALCFVITELGLYLDTHKEDKEAFKLLQQYVRLAEEGTQRYEASYGPLTLCGTAAQSQYDWLNSPWPWEFQKEGER